MRVSGQHRSFSWSTHRIRHVSSSNKACDSRHDTIPGIPHELYFLPKNHGGSANLIYPISTERIASIRKNLVQLEEENLYQEYFDFVMSNTDLQHPQIWREAEDLYLHLIALGKQEAE